MRTGKRVVSLLLAFALTLGMVMIPTMDAKAAVKTTTYTYDKKGGVAYKTAVRCGVMQTYMNDDLTMYLTNAGDYIAAVKASNGNLIAKVSYRYAIKGENSWTSGPDELGLDSSEVKFKKQYRIQAYAKKAGTYTLTVTVKNKSKKVIGTYKIKVFASEYDTPFSEISYAGQKNYYYSGMNISTKKDSGALKLKVNSKEYTLKKLEIGTADGEKINWKTIKNGAKITLAKSTVYSEVSYTSGNKDDLESYYYESGYKYDFLKPATFIRLTYFDKKLKIQKESEITIINVK